jgi:ADP-ribose pyrophosphatase
MHALYSVDALIYNLVADDFHLRIRAERPSSYPERQRISIDESPWVLDCETYAPPYHVDAAVLENDRTASDAGWADPEDFTLVRELPRIAEVKYRDDDGRPLNPHGRTGLAGRGLLGLWGANLSVAVLAVRANPDTGGPEILLGSREDGVGLELPKGFVLPEETGEEAVRRVLRLDAAWDYADPVDAVVAEGYTYDPRQTDNAWVETKAFLVLPQEAPTLLTPGGEFDEIKWRPLAADEVNSLPSDQARFVRESIERLVDRQLLDVASAEALLVATG